MTKELVDTPIREVTMVKRIGITGLLIATAWFCIWLLIPLMAVAYTPWQDNSEYQEKLGEAKIRVGQEIKTIKVFPITQENCIFVQMEDNPKLHTSSQYRQPHCASLRNQRIADSNQREMPVSTKVTHVPANEYFKINMVVSKQMSNRKGEEFGIQIIDAETKETQYLQGGWKPGDQKLTKAIKLKPGRYFWRCPLNPTPWYGLVAE